MQEGEETHTLACLAVVRPPARRSNRTRHEERRRLKDREVETA